jgi:hypothetical protein
MEIEEYDGMKSLTLTITIGITIGIGIPGK